MQKEVCWLITTRCNQNCQYCHRFLHTKDLTYEENEKILMKLINTGITHITWSGGEALLYPNILNLLKIAKAHGVKNKLITNGLILAKDKEMRQVYNYLDSLTLSIDSIDNDVNKEMGRGENHYNNIQTILEFLKDKKLKVNINTVVSKKNVGCIKNLGKFLNDYNINSWRIFKFIPLRETAKENQKQFEISKEEFESSKKVFQSFKNIKNIQYREEEDMENKYVLIVSNGDIIKTENGVDVKKGNMLKQSIDEILAIIGNNVNRNYTLNKIRTLIAHNDKSITNRIINAIKVLDFVEIIGTATEGKETYNKIIDLQPEIVFAKYNMSNMNGLEIIKLSEKKLEQKTPIFNMIATDIADDELTEAVNILGNKMQAIVREPYEERIQNILQDYKEYKYKGNL